MNDDALVAVPVGVVTLIVPVDPSVGTVAVILVDGDDGERGARSIEPHIGRAREAGSGDGHF